MGRHDEANRIFSSILWKRLKMNRVKNNEFSLQIDMFIFTGSTGSYWINGRKNWIAFIKPSFGCRSTDDTSCEVMFCVRSLISYQHLLPSYRRVTCIETPSCAAHPFTLSSDILKWCSVPDFIFHSTHSSSLKKKKRFSRNWDVLHEQGNF
jgi:hypothetical protein